MTEYIPPLLNLAMLGANVFMAHLLTKQSRINLELTQMLFEQEEKTL